jgi:rhodanese-related sulfurtransferase
LGWFGSLLKQELNGMGFLRRILGGRETDTPATGQAAVRREINANELAAKLEQAQPPFLLDVREPHEYMDAHITGATLIPLGELMERMSELPREREIVCVCHSGGRSSSATRYLLSAGYNVLNLSGGMYGWTHTGLPVKRGTDR